MPYRRNTLILWPLVAGRHSQLAAAASPRTAFGIPKSLMASPVMSSSSRATNEPLQASKTNKHYGVNASKPPSIECDEPSTAVQRVFATDKRPVILFDGVCNLCNGAVNLALDWDPQGKLRFSALQSNVGQALLQANGRAADDISSIVLVNESGAYVKSDAILRISEALTPLKFLPLKPVAVVGRWVVPRFLRDLFYDGVANNRYKLMGKQDQCRFDADGEFEDRFVNDDIILDKM